MAITVKADTEDFPSILAMFGLNGMPTDQAATGAPESQPPDSPDAPKGKTPSKLQLLQHTLAGGSHDDAAAVVAQGQPPPIDPAIQGAPDAAQPLNPGQGEVLPPARNLRDIIGGVDPSQLIAAAQGNNTFPAAQPDQMPATAAQANPALPAKPNTFQGNHPTLAKILNIAATLGAGAGAGAGARDFGGGFQRGAEIADPIKKKMQDVALAEKQAGVAHTQAATEQLKSQVTLPNGLTVPFALAQKLFPAELAEMGKDKRNQANIDSRETIAGDKNALALRSKGLKLDANGKQVPLSRDEMSEPELAALDLKQSQSGAAQALKTLREFNSDPNNPKVQIARELLKIHAQTAATAAGKLGLDTKRYLADYLGTDEKGNALPGVALTDNGTPEGVKITNATKPTNSTRSKAEQAKVIKQQGQDLIKQIDANPQMFGVIAGRWNDFNAGQFGDASPAVRDAYTSLKSFASLQPALHGSRGIGMQKEFEDALGTMKQNPEALKASVKSLMRTAGTFQQVGSLNTAPGGGAHPAATHVYDPSTGVIAPVKK